MAIQPTTRLAGSSHLIRFQGVLVAGATPQTLNATVPATAAPTANVPLEIKFALADLTALTDQTKRLPGTIFDDGQPAAASPHANTTIGGPSAGGGNVPAGKTWEQNVRVRAQELTASTAAPLIARIDVLTPTATIDTTTTGLSGNTGVPVIGISFAFTAAGVAAIGTAGAPGVGVSIVVEIEIPHSPAR